MKRFLPIVFVFLILLVGAFFILKEPQKQNNTITTQQNIYFTSFTKTITCAKIPNFLYKANIMHPIIDLSQIHYKGIAFIDAKSRKVMHKSSWERFDALGTYTIDKKGNLYLAPNPFISIKPTTFNLQKAIYKLDSQSGKLSRWMVIDEITPKPQNPYGIVSVLYDCKDNTLWAGAIDKSDFKGEKGRIYHIDIKNKEILEKVPNFDALTLAWAMSNKGKILLAGNAYTNALYAFIFKNNHINPKPIKLFELPNSTLRIRKIKVIAPNKIYLEAIKFSYSLIAQTAKKQRTIFIARFKNNKWEIVKKD